MIRLRSLGPELCFRYSYQDWVTELEKLLGTRYLAIESRLLDSFRFVDLHEDNKVAFSAGYASMLRDACSAYSSTCDRLVRATKFLNPEPTETNNGHYRDFLLKNVPTIADVCVKLDYSYGDKYLIPFDAFRHEGSSDWWDAFTNLKHTEFDDFKKGNLVNCLNAVGGLMVLVKLLDYTSQERGLLSPESKFASRLFAEVGTPFGGITPELLDSLFGKSP